ncbi:MAG: energy-coupling factor transporter transmembrane protein EcfT [Chloroflexi bacterium]|nr:energy-coupling factor transporter transmembrane protein EcfT [Chloroflexota bacterium]
MERFDTLRHVSIGQYIPGESVVHRLDPRVKLLAFGLLVVATVLATTYLNNALLLLVVLAVAWMARLPLGYLLANIKPALPIIVFFALLQLLFYGARPGDRLLLQWGTVRISFMGVRLVIVSLARFLDLILLTSLLTNTTTTGALTHGLERLLAPLNVLHLPGHELAMVGAIALRFVPILGEQLESIMKAQASRGVGFDAGGRWQLIANARRVARLIIPLFVDAFRRSEEMMLAFQARCYRGGRGRTHLVQLCLALRDYVALLLSLTLLAAIILIRQFHLP